MKKQKFLIRIDLGPDGATFLKEEFTEKAAWRYMRAWGKRCLRLGVRVGAWRLIEIKGA